MNEPLPQINDKILDLCLDEIEQHYDLLESEVKPFLRKSNTKPSGRCNPNREITDEEEVRRKEEEVYNRNRRLNGRPIPEIVMRGRTHYSGAFGRLYARNMLYEVTDEDLHTLFGAYGPLKRAAINFDSEGRSLGTALVVFQKRNDAQKALQQLDGKVLDGRKLFLKLLDSHGMRADQRVLQKNRGDKRPVDNVNVLKDRETITEKDLNMELDEYITQRKRAKTWNYH